VTGMPPANEDSKGNFPLLSPLSHGENRTDKHPPGSMAFTLNAGAGDSVPADKLHELIVLNTFARLCNVIAR